MGRHCTALDGEYYAWMRVFPIPTVSLRDLVAVWLPIAAFVLLTIFAVDTQNPTVREYQQVFLFASVPVVIGLVVIGTLFILIIANDPLRVLQRQRAIDQAPREKVVAPPVGP